MDPKSYNTLGIAFSNQTDPVSGTTKAIDDSSASIPLAQLVKAANLAEANASEEDKIKAMMIQSCHEYDPTNYLRKPLGPPLPPHTCFRCGKPGHDRKSCPRRGDKNLDPVPRIKKSTGIPRSFLMEVQDPNTKGALLTKTGKYAIPIINVEAYARRKEQEPPLLPEEPPSSEQPVPDELLCLLCKDLLTDAAVIPCCGNSYCDECIRTALLGPDEHTCPTCHQTGVSPDALVANKALRQAVNSFRNRTGYSKHIQKLLQLPLPPPPAPLIKQTVTHNLQPLIQPTVSRQQDPLMIPLASLASRSAAASSSLVPDQSPVAARLPVNPSSVTVSDHPPAVSQALHAEKPEGSFESKSLHSASSYSRTSCTYSKSRPGSSRSRSCSQSFSHLHSCSWQSSLYPRDKGKSCSYRSRSRSPVLYHHSRFSQLSPDLVQETDEAAFVPDYDNSGIHVSAKDEEAAGKNPREPQEKVADKRKQGRAAPAAAEHPEASRSQSQSSLSVSHSPGQSQDKESKSQSFCSHASSGESQANKKKEKLHKKHRKHTGNETELLKSQKHKHKKKKSKKGQEKKR